MERHHVRHTSCSDLIFVDCRRPTRQSSITGAFFRPTIVSSKRLNEEAFQRDRHILNSFIRQSSRDHSAANGDNDENFRGECAAPKLTRDVASTQHGHCSKHPDALVPQYVSWPIEIHKPYERKVKSSTAILGEETRVLPLTILQSARLPTPA